MIKRLSLVISAALALLPLLSIASGPPDQADTDAWFNSKSTSEVNEGNLNFLTSLPAKPVHHHQNRIFITPESLSTGWAELVQCHDHLDAVQRAQITFREGHIRDLKLTETHLVSESWVEGPSIQLRSVHPGARLCLSAQTRALGNSGGGGYSLNSGPYMRKFLDGYYPMRVSLEIAYPQGLLQLTDLSPKDQPGFTVRQSAGLILIDTLFEGELRIQAQFERK